MPAIRVTKLGKRYVLGNPDPGSISFREALSSGWRRPRQPERELWALRDVSFDIDRGEVVGVVGANGAGKSTLLKILSRITEPTAGRVELAGRVSGLLEVGTGFHQELSGRENIYFNGAILGMTRREIERKFDEIVRFAEVEKFIDMPVKRYSSGMYLRLAFAVAAHLEPEILVVDEVLAVGDAAFQKKCLGKMGEAAGEGRTALFVSHNLAAVRGLCRRTLWLDGGRLQADGPTNDVLGAYLRVASNEVLDREWPVPGTDPGSVRLRLLRARVLTDDPPSDALTVRTPLRLEFEYELREGGAPLSLSVLIRNAAGEPAFNTVSFLANAGHAETAAPGRYRSICRIPGDLLNDGLHRVELLFLEDRNRGILGESDVLVFQVHDVSEWRDGWYGRWAGAVRPMLAWHTERMGDSAS